MYKLTVWSAFFLTVPFVICQFPLSCFLLGCFSASFLTHLSFWSSVSVHFSHSVMSDSLRPPWTAACQASLSFTSSQPLCLSGDLCSHLGCAWLWQGLSYSHSISVSSLTQSCPTLCNPMDCSVPGFPVHEQLLELAQTHVHRVSDAIQPSHPLPSPSPSAFNLSQHQGLSQWVSSSHQVARGLELQLQHQSFQWIFRTEFL